MPACLGLHAAPGQVDSAGKPISRGGQHGKAQGGAAAVQRLAVGAGQADFQVFIARVCPPRRQDQSQ